MSSANSPKARSSSGHAPSEVPDTTTGDRLIAVVQELSLARDVDAIITVFRKYARELTGADGATFVLREGEMCYYADEDAISPLWKGQRFPLETCISGWAMLNRQPAIIEDIYVDSRIPFDAYRPTFVKSLAMVPIRTASPIGAIGNYWAKRHMPTLEEVRILQALADTTSIALENVQLYTDLERRVRERTEQLEFLNKELNAFTYSVSHDLRAPLRHIHGFADLLLTTNLDQLDPTGQKHLRTIQKSAKRMEQLIEDLLMFSRLGRSELTCAPVRLERLVEEVWDELQPEIGDRQVDFTLSPLPVVEADASLLRQVFANLLGNAIKYTRPREIAQIELRAVEEAERFVFSIRDNGVGFDMSQTRRLFNPFQRLHDAATFEGTGIGLANVRRIIARHGGRTWAEGVPNNGATFFFTLPKPSVAQS